MFHLIQTMQCLFIKSSSLVVSELVSEQIGTGKSLGTGIGIIWYREKVAEPVLEKFGIRKKSQNQYQ